MANALIQNVNFTDAVSIPPKRQNDSAPRRLDYNGPLHRSSFMGDSFLQLTMCGKDRTGMIRHISRLASERHANIDSGFTCRLRDQYAGAYFLLSGDTANLELLQEELKRTELEHVDGNQILPAKLFEIEFEGQDRIGLLRDLTNTLFSRDINIVTMKLEVIDDLESPKVVVVHMRVEVPEEQLSVLSGPERWLQQLDPTARVVVRERPRSAELTPAEELRILQSN